MVTKSGSTVIGAVAILSWGTLGALGALSASIDPYLVLGLCFSIAFALGFGICRVTGVKLPSPKGRGVQVAAVLLIVYHLTYLEAFHHAAAIPVSLINYLWPACLIVIGNMFFRLQSGVPGYLGAAVGFLGVGVLVAGGGLQLSFADVTGYALALFGALCWATYSNVRRTAIDGGIGAMVTITGLAAFACLLLSFALGAKLSALTLRDVAVILMLGIGPAGGAFFLWDIGMRRGDAALLGVLGYAAPVLSTILMLALGLGTLTWNVFVAVALISLGGVIVQRGGGIKSGKAARQAAFSTSIAK